MAANRRVNGGSVALSSRAMCGRFVRSTYSVSGPGRGLLAPLELTEVKPGPLV